MAVQSPEVPIRSRAGVSEVVFAPRLIDLFCGAGGLTCGFSRAGYQPVWANELDPNAARSYNLNFGEHCVVGDLVSILQNPAMQIPAAEIVIGGPPCQGFSLLNKDRVGDERRQLWRPFLEVVRLSGANAFVMENVPQLIGSPEHAQIQTVAEQMGFKTVAHTLNAADYGVPQSRKRAFIVGSRDLNPSLYFPPPPSHDSSLEQSSIWGLPRRRTVRDAIGDLPPPVGTELRPDPAPLNLHFGRNPSQMSLSRYAAVPGEGMNRVDLLRNAPELTPKCWINKKGGTDLFGRLWWDRPAFTIRTEFFKPEKGRYLHPEQHRPITHREAARLQGFPDSFEFFGSKISIARQIGNAVPPPLAQAVAQAIKSMISAVTK